MAQVVITGVKALDRKLAALGAKVANKVVVQAMRRAMVAMKASVEQLAPRGGTGDLSASAKLRAGKRSRSAKSIQVYFSDKQFRSSKWYAALVEKGHKTRGGKLVKPAGFMKAAFETTKDRARDEVMGEIVQGIEREAAHG